uniref:Uncharacterized protein n=1 Tax=Podoviridae sp. ctG4L18 TaxID=2825234 RepID=A0A8S5UPB3_9CAUD|nr:MAG TPA: hypothetical protein [Podoviridae sp. ctG4L18]DAM40960.1 MAG TPA: hypothetical protein [Bacteriophage sp.]DAR39649.1 MAG TPA: hypothetical protein [Caudoviricetes sp.]
MLLPKVLSVRIEHSITMVLRCLQTHCRIVLHTWTQRRIKT